MALTIRLERQGKKKQPYYRIVVTESTNPRHGRFVDLLGQYNPLREPTAASVDEAKVRGWLDRGAKPSDTVRSLLSSMGILERWVKGAPPSAAQLRGPVPSGKAAVAGSPPAGTSGVRKKKAAQAEEPAAEAKAESEPAETEAEPAEAKAGPEPTEAKAAPEPAEPSEEEKEQKAAEVEAASEGADSSTDEEAGQADERAEPEEGEQAEEKPEAG